MAEEDKGGLTKLIIKSYSTPEFNETTKAEGTFETLLNPEKYSRNYKSEYQDLAPPGSSSKDMQYVRTEPEDLDLEFLFDGTGIFKPRTKTRPKQGMVPGGPASTETVVLSVEEQIEEFKKVGFRYNGELHQPNYLWIIWGSLSFQGVMLEMNIEYKLFGSDGKPLRAIAKVKFKSTVSTLKQTALENKKSPDLTHARIVQQGDTLPLMSARIYGDAKYYLEVARVNKLATFRKLKAGQQIIFPPIQKPS